MNIPDKAVEAASRDLYARSIRHQVEYDPREKGLAPTWEGLTEYDRDQFRDIALPYLISAAPFIAAQALDEASLASRGQHFPTAPDVTLWLDSLAERFERGEMDPQ